MNIKNGTFLIILSALLIMPAFADGSAFTPLNFDDTAYSVPSTQKATSTPATSAKPAVSVSNSSVNNSSTVNTSTAATRTVGNSDLQSAISKIDAVNEFLCQDVDEKIEYEDTLARMKSIFAD